MMDRVQQGTVIPSLREWNPRRRLSPVSKGLCDWAAVEPNERVLHVGCGDGEVLSRLSAAAPLDLCGLDGSLDNVRTARDRLRSADILYGVSDDIMWRDNAFHTVLCTFPLWERCDPARLMREAYRVLRVGGQIVLAGASLPTLFRQAVNSLIDADLNGVSGELFHSRAEYTGLLTDAGFRDVTWHAASLTAGVAVGWKAEA